MKIIGGQFKGRNFYMPKGVRPTQNVIREAIFDILGQDLTGSSFLELFAGSGAVGLEAISRGADKVTMVEKDHRCVAIIQDSLRLFNINILEDPRVELINSDVFSVVKQFSANNRKFDVIFLDPPYGRDLIKKALKTLEAYDIFNPDSILIIEHSKHERLPDMEGRFLIIRQKKYGASYLTFYQRNQSTDSK